VTNDGFQIMGHPQHPITAGLQALAALIPEWHADAVCAQVDPDTWFPEKGGSTRDPKAICAGCPVRQQCLDYALEHDERFGIWGGVSERQRRQLKKARAAA
jgi:WhiB family redox-sensing transcriptional regulator